MSDVVKTELRAEVKRLQEQIARLLECIILARDELEQARKNGVDDADVNEALDQLGIALFGKGES